MNEFTVVKKSEITTNAVLTKEEKVPTNVEDANGDKELLIKAANTYKRIAENLFVKASEFKDAAEKLCTQLTLTYDSNNPIISPEGEVLVKDSEGNNWWAKLPITQYSLDVFGFNKYNKSQILNTVYGTQGNTDVKELLNNNIVSLRFEIDKEKLYQQFQNNTLPINYKGFITEIKPLFEIIEENLLRPFEE